MSVIVGVRRHAGDSAQREELLTLARATSAYATDGTSIQVAGTIGMAFQANYTHERSRLERQPTMDASGNLVTFDGRLDNYCHLCSELHLRDSDVADSQIVLAAFARWGEDCFKKLIGDWAMVLWSSRARALYLARDHAGTRTLFYHYRDGVLTWSTYLDTFFVEGKTYKLTEAYAARYLCNRSIGTLTPYEGIVAVPPAHYVVACDRSLTAKAHWSCLSAKKICYQSDEEYDERFLSLFSQSVKRRTGLGAPILALLSGGMDSSSIVCMSDHLRRSEGDPRLLDTVSFYNDSEPNWDERPYFSVVEAQRGKAGIHIDTSQSVSDLNPLGESRDAYLYPGATSRTLAMERDFRVATAGNEYRSILSGIGGDELLGGVPTPLPELADYLVSGRFIQFVRRSWLWCLNSRTPISGLLLQTGQFSLGCYLGHRTTWKDLPPWVMPRMRDLCLALEGDDGTPWRSRAKSLPSAISQAQAWQSVVESEPHLFPGALTRYEYLYPYLDRDLVDYLLTIPREKLVGPGRRRALMRRALKGIVPNKVLERRRKGFLSRTHLALLRQELVRIEAILSRSLAVEWGFVDPTVFRLCLRTTVQEGDLRWTVALMTTIVFELWLQANLLATRAAVWSAAPHEYRLRKQAVKKLHAVRIAD